MEKENNKMVLSHPEDGVYLGNAMGLGFWSELDPAGQDSAITFTTEEDVRKHVESWDGEHNFDDYRLLKVDTSNDYATMAECVTAGASPWLLDEAMTP